MEKVVYLLAFGADGPPTDLTPRLRGPVGRAILDAGARRVTVNVGDDHVAGAAPLRMAGSARPADAVVSVWVDSAVDHLRAPVDAAVAGAGARPDAYLVTESVPLVDPRVPSAPGGRVDGYAQVATFCRPEGQDPDEWRHLWLDLHTPVAIATQDTFSYVQNVVVRALTPGAPARHAIVEECFPEAAMTDPYVFYDAVGDDERLARHQRELFASVQRFIDLATIDVLPTSRYDLNPPGG